MSGGAARAPARTPRCRARRRGRRATAPLGERQRAVDGEQLAQPVKPAVERRLRVVAFGIRPQLRGQHRRVDVAAAERHQRLQHVERPFLRLALRHQRNAVADDDELAERAQRERPRPVGRRRRRRRQLPLANQRPREFGLDPDARGPARAAPPSDPGQLAQEAHVAALAAAAQQARAAAPRRRRCGRPRVRHALRRTRAARGSCRHRRRWRRRSPRRSAQCLVERAALQMRQRLADEEMRNLHRWQSRVAADRHRFARGASASSARPSSIRTVDSWNLK